jgi:hypothetical protein
MICDGLWLTWWQLPNWAVVFKYRLVTALVLLASDSRILSVSSTIVAEIWHQIEETVAAEDPNAERKHPLWALVFLKVYTTSEEVHCAIVGWPHVQTFQKYSWYFVENFFDLQNDVIV